MNQAPADSPRRRSALAAFLLRPTMWLSAAALAAGLFVVRMVLVESAPPPQVYFEVPDFTLTDQDGKPFGRRDLDGDVWVAGFFFTRCPSICPLLTQRMKSVQSRAERLDDEFHLVQFSIDPTNDTPEAMRRFAADQGVVLKRWSMLTGSTEAIQRVVREGFKEYMLADPGMAVEDVVHSVRFFLVDRRGQVRGLYDGMQEAEIKRLLRDARTLSKEPRVSGQGTESLR